MRSPLTRTEWWVVVAVLGMVGVWFLLPTIQQPPEYHDFADHRTFLGMPNAADVLSNDYVPAANDFDHAKVQADADGYQLPPEFESIDVEAIRARI